MRNPNRIEPTIDRIKKHWEEHPDQRLTQIILNIVKFGMNRDFSCPQVYNVEEDELIKGLDRMQKLLELSKKEKRVVDSDETV